MTPAQALRECGICQSSIYPDEGTIACPSCRLVFHAECWNDNFGCAAYGCEQVNILKPREPQAPPVDLPQPIDRPVERLPWNFMLLGAAALAAAASTITWGIPSLLVAGLVYWRGHLIGLWRRRQLAEPVLLVAAALSLIGLVAGVFISRLWWS